MLSRLPFRSQLAVVLILGVFGLALGLPLIAGATSVHQTSSGTATAGTTTATGTVSVTTTPVGTGTVTPTGVPLAASPLLVSRFTVHRSGQLVRFRWKMAFQAGIKGFELFAGKHRLTRHPLRPHASPVYRYSARWNGHGPYSLLLLPEFGKPVRVHPTG